MLNTVEQDQRFDLFKYHECLCELIKSVYLLGLHDGKELRDENDEIREKIGNIKVSKIIEELNLN